MGYLLSEGDMDPNSMPPVATNFFKNSLELHRFLASRALCTIAVLQEVIQIFNLKKRESCRKVFDVLLISTVTDELVIADSVIETMEEWTKVLVRFGRWFVPEGRRY